MQAYAHEATVLRATYPEGYARRVALQHVEARVHAVQLLEDKIRKDNATKPHLQPLYCAVYFCGPSFSTVESGNWFIYRLHEATHSAALAERLLDRYPFARVVTPNFPVVVQPTRASATPMPAAQAAADDGTMPTGGVPVPPSASSSGSSSTSSSSSSDDESSQRFQARKPFLGVPADASAPCADHIYVYPALLVSAQDRVTKEVTDSRGNVHRRTVPGSCFQIWVCRTLADVGMAQLAGSNVPATAGRTGSVATATDSMHGRGKGKKGGGFFASEMGPCLLGAK